MTTNPGYSGNAALRIAGLLIALAPAAPLLAQQALTMSGNVTSGSVPCQAISSITTDPINGFTVSGSASVKCEAAGTITLLPGFHAVGGTSATTFDAFVVPLAITSALSNPASGAGGPAFSAQTFSITFSDVLGAADIQSFQLSFGGIGATANICSLSYSGGVLGLWSNDASQLNTTAPLQNSQCTVGSYTVNRVGNTLTFTTSITFQAPMEGAQEAYALALGSSGDYEPFMDLGTWTVTAPTTRTAPFGTAGTQSSPRLKSTYSWSCAAVSSSKLARETRRRKSVRAICHPLQNRI